MMRVLKVFSLAILLLGLAACSSSQESPVPGSRSHALTQPLGNAGFSLPLPSELAGQLPAARRASYVPADLYKAAETFNQSLPFANVVAAASSAQYSPDWTPASPGLQGLAYAMYDFQIPGFDLNPSIEYSWVSAPANYGNVYLGLANWDTDRWDWYPAESDKRIDLPSLDSYFDFGGDLIICLLMTGTAPAALDGLRIASVPPVPQLVANKRYGFAPLSVSFDATGSTDADGTIAEYRWDPEGDGSFQESSGESPLFEWQYDAKGDYSPAVLVVDNDGVSTASSLQLAVLDSSFITFGTSNQDEDAAALVIRDDGKLLIWGRKHDFTNNNWKVYVALLNPVGGLESVRIWSGGSESAAITDAIRASDGFAYTCGRESGHGLIQKWSLDGELIWSRRIIGTPSLLLSNISIVDGLIFCSGTAGQSAAVVCTDMEATPQWSHAIPAPNGSAFSDMAVFQSFFVDGSLVSCVGNYVPGAGQYSQALYASFGTSGDLRAARLLGGTSATYASGIFIEGTNIAKTYIIGHYSVAFTTYEAFLSRIGGSTVALSDPSYVYSPTGISFNGAGNLALAIQCRSDLADQYSGFAIVMMDKNLNFVSGSLSDAGNSGGSLIYNQGSFSGQGQYISGQHGGAVPTTVPYTPLTAASTLAWTDFTPTVDSISYSGDDTSLELIDYDSYGLSPEGSLNAFVYIEPN